MQTLEAAPVTLEDLEAKREEVRKFEEAISFHFQGSKIQPQMSAGDSPLKKLESLIAQTKSQQEHEALGKQAQEALEVSKCELQELEARYREQELRPQFDALLEQMQALVDEANAHTQQAIAVYKQLDELRQAKADLLRFGGFTHQNWYPNIEGMQFLILYPKELARKQFQELTISDRAKLGV